MNEFHDPALKTALRRTVGTERAPAQLRGRVQQALDNAAATPASMQRARTWRQRPLVGLAAAALIIIGAALALNFYLPGGIFGGEKFELPRAFASDMTRAHEREIAQPPYHDLDVSTDDLSALRQALKDKLGHPVLVASLDPEWKIEGAQVTTVGQTSASQVVYTNGSERISIFSLSGSAYYATEEGADYKQMFEGHPIAGIVQGGAVHCVVASKGSKLSLKQIAALRDRAKKQISHALPSSAAPEGVESPASRV